MCLFFARKLVERSIIHFFFVTVIYYYSWSCIVIYSVVIIMWKRVHYIFLFLCSLLPVLFSIFNNRTSLWFLINLCYFKRSKDEIILWLGCADRELFLACDFFHRKEICVRHVHLTSQSVQKGLIDTIYLRKDTKEIWLIKLIFFPSLVVLLSRQLINQILIPCAWV